jgi:endoglucanase
MRSALGLVLGCILATLFSGALLLGQSAVSDVRYANLARGVNLTRWFQYGSRIPITAADRDLLQHAGFTSVRIPVAPQYLLYYATSPERIERNLANLDKAIDLFLSAGMAVTLDFHADAEYLDHYLSTPGAPETLVNVWRELATRYANRDPDLLFFEIMNEPDNRFTQAAWDIEQHAVLAAIRERAPRQTVILDAVNWSGLDALLQMTPYSDPNVIYALHYYSPSTFTHQGADWTGKQGMADLRAVPWPAYLPEVQGLIDNATSAPAQDLLRKYRDEDWDASRIDWDLQLAAAWAKRWGVRVIVNEFGDFKPFSPPDSRVRWLHDIHLALEKQKLAWAVWDYAAGFDLSLLHDGVRTIDLDVSAALGLQSWKGHDPARPSPAPMFSSLRTVQLGAPPDSAGYAEAILVADVNADGLPDLVVTPMTWPEVPAHPVQVFLNAGNGVFSPIVFAAPQVRAVASIVAGHFDASGRPGFFLPDAGPHDGSGAQSKLMLPAPDGTLKDGALKDASANLPQEIAVASGAAAGDVNGDGYDDLAVFRPQGLQLLRNDGHGNFANDPEAFPPPASDPRQDNNRFTCGAFVKRGDSPLPDLLVFGKAGTPARVFTNDGEGHFRSSTLLPAPPLTSDPATGGCTVVTDLNGDGYPDVIVAYKQPNALQVLINNGDGTFRDETATRLPPLPASNADIRRIAFALNMLVVTRVGEPPLIRIGQGNWTTVSGPWVAAPGDFNNDGRVDLIFGQGGGAPVVARFGQ